MNAPEYTEQQIDFCTVPELRALLRWAVAERRDDFASRISDRLLSLHESQKNLVVAARMPLPWRRR